MSARPLLPYGRQSIDDDDVAAVVETLRGDWLTQGPTVARFEARLAEITGARYAVAVASGTAALHVASLAAGVGPTSTGLTSTNTFVASANAIRYAGGTPGLVDIDSATGLISIAALDAKVTALAAAGQAPRVITPVDFSGSVPDLAAIRKIADRVGALVIEDAAHSLGSTYEVEGQTFRAAGCAHADLAILSFHPVKTVTTGEGGAITTNDARLYETMLELRSHGITRDPAKLLRNDGPWYYEQQSLGYHYRITDIQCALGITQLAKLERFVARRQALAARYDAAFAEADLAELVAPLEVPAGVSSAYHLYVVRLKPRAAEGLEALAARRRALFVSLRAAQIACQVHYIPVHTQPDFVRHGLADGAFPGADAYYASCLSLPMFPAMQDADVDYVVASVRTALREARS